jgi:hypothetical protein
MAVGASEINWESGRKVFLQTLNTLDTTLTFGDV